MDYSAQTRTVSRRTFLRIPVFGFLVGMASTLAGLAVEITETNYQGRPQFLVRTEQATYYFDRAGGGFSRLIDRDGRDWINFSKNPLKKYPDSAAAGYRGIPNLVFGSDNPDAGAGHPGFDQCSSELAGPATIRTTSHSQKWQWSWTFREHGATFTMEKHDPDHPWWFLYEGPIAGSFAPSQKFWATDQDLPTTDIPHNREQRFGNWRWAYFGDLRTPRVLYLIQHQPDELPDTLWYLGSSQQGAATAPDGMLVFGFGRGPGTRPQFNRSSVQISLGFLGLSLDELAPLPSKPAHERLAKTISEIPNDTIVQSRPRGIEWWYGDQQSFGQLGRPQRWINLLGTAKSPGDINQISYQLDGGPAQPLSLGTDLHRLALPGDFNVELPYEDLSPGQHQVTVTADYTDNHQKVSKVNFHVENTAAWPLPYHVDFSQAENLQHVTQIVDGHWKLTRDGVRTRQRYYDRVLSMGDQSWQNYDARIKLTIHDFTPSQPSAPTYNVTHFGVALRWRGHTEDGRQPSRQWYPLGAQGEFLLKPNLNQHQFRILHHGGPRWKPTYGRRRHSIQLDHPLWIRAQVYTSGDGSETTYRFKQWNDGEPEPTSWSVTSTEPTSTDLTSGSLCLVPHNSDVTIHSVSVTPL